MAMTSAGFDGTVGEADFARMWDIGTQEGCSSVAAWKVTQGSGRQVSVAAQSGYAFGKGVVSTDTAANTANLSTPTNGQFYLIARHIDWSTNSVSVVALAGPTTASATSVPTAPPTDYSGVTGLATTPGGAYDQPLGWAWVNSNNTTVTIWDLRRIPGAAADLDALALRGGPEGEVVTVTEGATRYVRRAGRWQQMLPSKFATAALRDSAFAKASNGYRIPGALARLDGELWDRRYGSGGTWKPYAAGADKLLIPVTQAMLAGTNLGTGGSITVDDDGVIRMVNITSLTVDGVFSADFDNYCVVVDYTASATGPNLAVRVRSGGSDIASAYGGRLVHDGNGGTPASYNNATGFPVAVGGPNLGAFVMDLIGPFSSTRDTKAVIRGESTVRASATYVFNGGGYRLGPESDTGFTFQGEGGVAMQPTTGTVRVYGYV